VRLRHAQPPRDGRAAVLLGEAPARDGRRTRRRRARLRASSAKFTICPGIAHGIDAHVDSVEVGKLADLVLWDPAFFAIRPRLVIKRGAIAWAPMGDPNASIPTPQPVLGAPMSAGSGRLAGRSSMTFATPPAIDEGELAQLGLESSILAIADTRALGKADMPQNTACPRSASSRTRSRLDRRRGDRAAARRRAAARAAHALF
jgi:urease alpha subunit